MQNKSQITISKNEAFAAIGRYTSGIPQPFREFLAQKFSTEAIPLVKTRYLGFILGDFMQENMLEIVSIL